MAKMNERTRTEAALLRIEKKLDLALIDMVRLEGRMAVTGAQIKGLLDRVVASNAELRKDVTELINRIQQNNPGLLTDDEFKKFEEDVAAAEKLGQDTDAANIPTGGEGGGDDPGDEV